MKLDAVFHSSLADAPKIAQGTEAAGLHGLWTLDTGHNPFFPLLLAAEHTSRLELGTGVAVALARSPMTLAQEAWDLASISKGRFILGLGSQIKPHIVKRFSMPWDKPVEQMREMIGALRAIWAAFQGDGKIKFEGKYYNISLLTPFFNPGPIEHPRVPIALAGVGPHMTELAGEIADGFMLHPFINKAYFDSVTLPALEKGLAKSGRHRSELQVIAPVFLITGDDKQQAKMEAKVRQQIAFYGSTPAYEGVLEVIGHGELHKELHRLSREGGWEQMARIIPDEVVEAFALRAALAELPQKLVERYHGYYDRIVSQFPIPVDQPQMIQLLVNALDRLTVAEVPAS